ncbi:MAG TPA: hypothetical protein VJ749_12730 [Pyrinomonadaceae bacterium]|jgi:hypothetical protein|nr:hypothetical protein [Pyrinomonadaceae bacterium]
MRYVLVLILGILLGGVGAAYLLGIGPARKAPGVAVKPPDNGQNPPATVEIGLEQSFVDAVLATTFQGLGTPTFQLGQAAPHSSRDQITTAAFQGGCANSITLLPEGSGVKTGVQFHNGNVTAPLAFTGSYSFTGQCIQFKGWAQTSIKLYFEEPKQTVYGNVTVEGVNLEGVNPIANTFVTVFVQSAINQRVNPLVLVSDKQLQLLIPVKASNGTVKAHAKDVRAEILDGALKLHLTYEFSGVRGEGT